MRNLLAAVLALALGLGAAGPAPAQSLFGDRQGLLELLDELQTEIAPYLDELGARLDPYLSELRGMLGDLTGWERPEVLPNGDILIRRRPPPPDQPDEAPVTDPFEL